MKETERIPEPPGAGKMYPGPGEAEAFAAEAEALDATARACAAGAKPTGEELERLRTFAEAAADPMRAAVRGIDGAAAEGWAKYSNAVAKLAAQIVERETAPDFADALRNSFPAKPTAPEWLCDDGAPNRPQGWIPAEAVTVLTGRGGAGKSRISLQLAVAVAAGRREFLQPENADAGRFPAPKLCGGTPAPVIFATWETAKRVVDWRLACALRGVNIEPEDLGGRFVHANMRHAAGGGLWGVERGAHVSTAGGLLPAGAALLAEARAREARLLVVDPVAAAFLQNENDRALVRAFLAHLGAFAEDSGCAVLIVSHPQKYGGEAQSGSPDWRNGVQCVLDLGPERGYPDRQSKEVKALETDRVVLRVEKSNEGGLPDGVTVEFNRKAMRFEACAATEGVDAANWSGGRWKRTGNETQPENGNDNAETKVQRRAKAAHASRTRQASRVTPDRIGADFKARRIAASRAWRPRKGFIHAHPSPGTGFQTGFAERVRPQR